MSVLLTQTDEGEIVVVTVIIIYCCGCCNSVLRQVCHEFQINIFLAVPHGRGAAHGGWLARCVPVRVRGVVCVWGMLTDCVLSAGGGE